MFCLLYFNTIITYYVCYNYGMYIYRCCCQIYINSNVLYIYIYIYVYIILK